MSPSVYPILVAVICECLCVNREVVNVCAVCSFGSKV